MNRVYFFLFLLLPLNLFSQSFEGIVKYKLTLSGTSGDTQTWLMTCVAKDSIFHFVTENNDGRIISDYIFDQNKNIEYDIYGDKQTVYRHPISKTNEGDIIVVSTKKMEDNVTILGYNCKKYKIEFSTNGFGYVWATADINLGGVNATKSKSYNIDGVFIRTELYYADNNSSVIMELTSFEIMKVEDVDLLPPAGFKVIDGMPSGY